MSSKPENTENHAYWLVGATYGETEDQTSRFLQEGIWENGYEDQYHDQVKSIRVGDRIVIKSTYTRKNGLPFDSQGQFVSAMKIKAIGTVKENLGDGQTLKVEWEPIEPPREWYFHTYRRTVEPVLPGNWITDALIEFIFDEKPQDIDRFRNAPQWRERYGDMSHFKWTYFYEAIADKLLTYRHKRNELVEGIHAFADRVQGLSHLQETFADGSQGPLKDICPFTVMGIFNRGTSEQNRKAIASELANFLGVTEPVPDSFEGVPLLNNQRSWFFGPSDKRLPDDIDTLWEIFAQAIAFTKAESKEEEENLRPAFRTAYDKATQIKGVRWNLTMGLYWIRPWHFPTLDDNSQHYISKTLNIDIGKNTRKGSSNAKDYLTVRDNLLTRFEEETYPVHSFPELSLAAWRFKGQGSAAQPNTTDEDMQDEDMMDITQDSENITYSFKPYTVDQILTEGCFIAKERLEKILERLRSKKNLILQGPPGTGKTWLAKRLAFALIGQRDDSKVRAVQFHPNLSYEDFVRGWRPTGEGRLTLVDGPFLEMIKTATNDPNSKYIVVIEEINRGNPAQIFGEMLTLLEADKRTPDEALELSYKSSHEERMFIPANLYVIGTMNIADRSLALVDLALRRRFAFIELEPTLGKPWRDWVQAEFKIDSEILLKIESRINALNKEITADSSLGAQFRVGHSYVTPPAGMPIKDARQWFRQVVETEIGPLLDEYWFDTPEKSQKAKERLLEGF